MTAGLNIRIDIYRFSYGADDRVGGATPTGSLQYQDIRAMLSSRRPSQMMLEQGLETNRVYDLTIGAFDARLIERDEFEVVFPTDHLYYGDRFRITGVQETPRRRKHGGGFVATAERIERSRKTP